MGTLRSRGGSTTSSDALIIAEHSKLQRKNNELLHIHQVPSYLR